MSIPSLYQQKKKRTLALALGAAVSMALFGCAPMPVQHSAAIGQYQFDYQVSSPSDIAAQVFSGENHTYVSLPHGITLQAATGNGKLYTPKRHGPYWAVPGIAEKWTFATTQGIVIAHATGAALQIAKVNQAIATVQSTAPSHPTSIPVKNVGTPPIASTASAQQTSTLPVAAAGTSPDLPIPDTTRLVHTAKHPQAVLSDHYSVPKQWMSNSANLFTKAHHTDILIPGSDGRSLALRDALQRIIPAGWTSHIQAPVSSSMPVLWHKGPWTQSLQRMARDNLLVTHVSWKHTVVTVQASPAMLAGIPGMVTTTPPVTPKVPPQVIHEAALPASTPDTQQTFPWHKAAIQPWQQHSHQPASVSLIPAPSPIAPLAPPPPVIHFVAQDRQMLSHDLRVYLHKKEWHLAWNLTKDYPISVSFTLDGSTRQILQKLMALYPIMITVDAGNRTVVVTSNTRF